jgi:membrane-bound lytic murein transglycosylase MltF
MGVNARRIWGVVAAVAMLVPDAAAQQPVTGAKARQLTVEVKPWRGDFDGMVKRHEIRVLIPYSRTLYYVDKGRERGVAAELARDIERYLNKKYKKQLGERPLTMYLIPTTREKLFSELNAGRGDIAIANLTVTDARLKQVDFVAPKGHKPTRELIVTGPNSPKIATAEDLSGKTLHVRRASSYHESVVALNKRLKKAGKALVRIVLLPDELEDEDALEMLNAGLFKFVVVDDWKLRIWAQVLPNIKVREDLVLRAEGRVGWAIRKHSPKLTHALYDAYEQTVTKQGGIEARYASYNKHFQQISNNAGKQELKRFEQTIALFRKYGAKYGFDPLMLAAQGYQESQLKQEARSRSGAIGVMQLMPTTGKDLKVGNIQELEPNIHGGVKYMDQLMTRYLPDATFTEENRTLFAFASYNAGPGNISKARTDAAKRGLAPDQWFNNVELVVAEKIGMETTTYVRNIYKYYVAYRLIADAQAAREKARAKIERGK